MFSAPSFLASYPQPHKKISDLFRRISTERQSSYKLITEKLSVLLKNAAEKLKNDTFNILSVGCGNGAGGDFLIFEMVKNFVVTSRKKTPMFYQAIEEDAAELRLFKESADSWSSENRQLNSSFRWFVGSWQEFQTETKNDSTKFQLIHFIHSIYNMDVENTLCDCINNKLAKGGLIFCMVADPDNPLKRFYQAYPSFHTPIISSKDVVSVASKNGWKYDCFQIPYQIDLTDMFEESSTEGNLLMDFLTKTKDYRSVAEESELEQVEQYWLNDSKGADDGKRKTFGKVCAVIIYKF